MKMSRLCHTKSEDEQQLQSPPVLIGPNNNKHKDIKHLILIYLSKFQIVDSH